MSPSYLGDPETKVIVKTYLKNIMGCLFQNNTRLLLKDEHQVYWCVFTRALVISRLSQVYHSGILNIMNSEWMG